MSCHKSVQSKEATGCLTNTKYYFGVQISENSKMSIVTREPNDGGH